MFNSLMKHKLEVPKLGELRSKVRELVVGQENVIDDVSLTFYKHVLRLIGYHNKSLNNVVNNILITGPSGTGKTFIVKNIAKLMNIPVVSINSKDIVPSGYKGSSITEILSSGFKDIQSLEASKYAVIFMDEFDKICMSEVNSEGTKWHHHIQSGLLKLIEGTEIEIRGRMYDTSHFLFIFAGAFTDLKYGKDEFSIGFSNEQVNKIKPFQDALISFGVMREVAGRIVGMTKTSAFDEKMYRELLENENSPFNQWFNYLISLGVKVHIDSDYAKLINLAVKSNLGARGLIQLMEKEVNVAVLEALDTVNLTELWDKMFEISLKKQVTFNPFGSTGFDENL